MFMIRKNGEYSYNFERLEEAVEAASRAEAEVVRVEVVRSWPPLLTPAQRNLLEEKVDLKEYASMCLAGDGLEIDQAVFEVQCMTDMDLVNRILLSGVDFNDADQEEIEEAKKIIRETLGVEEADQIFRRIE